MDKTRFIALLVKEDSGAITSLELKELEELERNNPDLAALRHIFNTVAFETAAEKIPADQSQPEKALFKKIEAQLSPARDKERKKVVHLYRWRAAAVIIGVLLSSSLVFFYSKKRLFADENIVATKKGSRSTLVLPDGTKVWINADSRLSYPEKFTAATREVRLTGEAFFEVIKDAKHPFIVHTENIDVKVLGTRFNVRAYPGETSTQTTLLKGSVEVLLKNNNDKRVMLSPNEKLIVQNSTETENKKGAAKQAQIAVPAKVELVTVRQNLKDSSTFETEWMLGRLVFNSERVADIIPVLERWYNTTIVFKGKPSGQTFSGSFKDAPLEDVLKTLKISAGINYKTENGKIEIY